MKWISSAFRRLSPEMLALLPALAFPLSLGAQTVDPPPRSTAQSLVEQLGHSDPTMRELAQTQLSRMGPAAYESLLRARQHRDVEISLSARRLLEQLDRNQLSRISCPQTAAVVGGYSQSTYSARLKSITQLGRLGTSPAIRALCRIARSEPTDSLAKQAALRVITSADVDPRSSRKSRSAIIREEVQQLGNAACQWLDAYAQWLEDPNSLLACWDPLIDRQLDRQSSAGRNSDGAATLALLRWFIDHLLQNGFENDADRRATQLVQVLSGADHTILEAADWLVERQFKTQLIQLASRCAAEFEQDVRLQYRIAEMHLRQGNYELAEETARRARSLTPEETGTHLEIGLHLSEMGYPYWARQSFAHVIQQTQTDSINHWRARCILAELLFQGGEFQAAADILDPVIASARDRRAASLVQQATSRTPDQWRARKHLCLALHYRQQDQWESELGELIAGLEVDTHDVDLLIELYGVAQRSLEMQYHAIGLLQPAIDQLQQEIAQLQRLAADSVDQGRALAHNRRLASLCNRYAWLVANTIGDIDLATKRSEQALLLCPDQPEYLDTMARCYFSQGKFREALVAQHSAVALQPHSPALRTRLNDYQRAVIVATLAALGN